VLQNTQDRVWNNSRVTGGRGLVDRDNLRMCTDLEVIHAN